MADFVGRDGSLAVFSNETDAVVIDTNLNLVVGLGKSDVVLSSRSWEPTAETFSDATMELASGALTTLDIKVITASGRMYTIPDGVVSEAKKALKWRKEEKRGGTPVGLNTARTLARGGQIGIEKIRHIAKYFPRHEVDKKGKGWEPGEDNFPSNGRIAWALWGGDAAWRWARAIVERENKKATTAGGYTILGYDADPEIYKTPENYDTDVDAFKDAFNFNEGVVPEFMARVRLDGSGMDRLYKLDTDGKVYVWDDMGWDALGHVDGDVWTYDKALDDPYDTCEKDHVIIDPESAIIMSALLQESPFGIVSIDDIDPEGAALFEDAAPEEDWEFLKTVTAAMPAPSAQQKAPSGTVAKDSVYSPKERSINAKSQTRDAMGKFVAKGSRVVVGGDGENGRGIVTGFNPATGGTRVTLDSGKDIEVPAKLTQKEDSFNQPAAAPANVPSAEELARPLDVSGVLGEPRSPVNQPNAQLPGTLPPMDKGALQDVIQNWGGYVESQRAAFKPISDQQARDYAKKTGQGVTSDPAKMDANKTQWAGLASKKAAVPDKDGKISIQDVPMAGRASLPSREKGSDGGTRDKTTETLDGLRDRTAYKNETFVPKQKSAAPSKPSAPAAPGKDYRPFDRTVPAEQYVNDKYGIGKKPSSAESRAQEGLRQDRNADRSKDRDGFNQDRLRQDRNADRKAPSKSEYDSKGRYIVQKGDSLWTIAEKTAPQGKNVADHWREIMKSNPRMKSGNPNLIYSGERVWIPGQGGSAKSGSPKFGDSNRDNLKPKGGQPGAWSTAPTKSAKPSGKSGDSNRDNLKPDKPKGQPGAWDTGKDGTGRPSSQKSSGPDTGRDERIARERMRQAKNSERAPKPFDDKGRYIVKKGDSLWSISNDYKPQGESTAGYWSKVMKANPKNQFKSGNPSLIYSGERVNLPGQGKPNYGDSNRDNLKPKTPRKFGDDNRDSVKPTPKKAPSQSESNAREAARQDRNTQRSEGREGFNQNRTRDVKNSERKSGSSSSSSKPAAPAKTAKAAPKPAGQSGSWDTGKGGTGTPTKSPDWTGGQYPDIGRQRQIDSEKPKPRGSAGSKKRSATKAQPGAWNTSSPRRNPPTKGSKTTKPK